MNQNQHNDTQPAARGAHCTNQHQQPELEQAFFQLDWFLLFKAMNLYATTGELTAPLTHIPQVIYDDDGHKTILVRHLCEGKQQNFFIGWPLNPQQIEAANKEWIDTEINVQGGN
jgi:hypothetical protein